MKYVGVLVAFCAVAFAAPAFAGDGNVPGNVLADLGLSSMKVVNDHDGMQVRGKSSAAATGGLSIVFGLLFDPGTASFVSGADGNFAAASATNGGFNSFSFAHKDHVSNVALGLQVTTNGTTFTGVLFGGAGGFGNAFGF